MTFQGEHERTRLNPERFQSARSAHLLKVWALVPLCLVTAVLAVPYFLTHNFLLIGLAIQHAFSLVCHQRPERSFWIFGAPVAVCARCLGIYLGATMGLLLRTSRRIAVQLLIAAVVLNALDVATELAGLHGNWMGVRLALGPALGAAGALLITSTARSYESTITPIVLS